MGIFTTDIKVGFEFRFFVIWTENDFFFIGHPVHKYSMPMAHNFLSSSRDDTAHHTILGWRFVVEVKYGVFA